MGEDTTADSILARGMQVVDEAMARDATADETAAMPAPPQLSAECRRRDERHASEPLLFGAAPSPYLPSPYLVEEVQRRFAAAIESTPAPGARTALCLGDGGGRDALYLARQGFAVTTVAGSIRGLDTLAARARMTSSHTRPIKIVHADLAGYHPPSAAFDLVTSFYCHLPPALRCMVHARAVRALRPGGYFVLEGFTPRQQALGLPGNGPQDIRLLMEPMELHRELSAVLLPHGMSLRIQHIQEVTTEITCGRYRGQACIVRLLGRRPGEPRVARRPG